MQPKAAAGSDRRDLVQRVDRAGVHRPRAREDDPWQQAEASVLIDPPRQVGHGHPQLAVDRHVAHRQVANPSDVQRLADGNVAFLGEVDHTALSFSRRARLARRHDRRQGR